MAIASTKKRNQDDDETEAPPPPDGGWGWMVVFGSFMIHIISEYLPNAHYFYILMETKQNHKNACNN